MKKHTSITVRFVLIFTFSLFHFLTFSQSIGINTDGSAPNATAILDIKSDTKGLLAPRMTTAQRAAIVTPANGLLVYDLSTNGFWYYNGSTWSNLTSSSVTNWTLTGNN